MLKKKYNIAIAGTFDVENYGDLLFPVVFEKAMIKRGLDFSLFLFSPLESAKKALDNDVMVYSYRDFEDLNSKYKFDALVVGGGAIIHFNNIKIKLPGKDAFVDYRNIDSWFTLIYLAAKNGIKILFNVPQAPFEFSESVVPMARDAFLATSYLNVRDSFSKAHIEKLFINKRAPKIEVFPDSVCSISEYYDKTKLEKVARKLLGFEGEFAVVHFSRVMPKEAEPDLVEAIHKLEENNYRVVFLPLGYTHGDDVAMKKFKNKYHLDCFIFSKKLSIDEMTAILAGCEIYIGTSFHGSIVSIAFGNKAISFNYYTPTLKNIDNYQQFGISNYLANTFSDLNPILDKLLENKDAYKPCRAEIRKKVEHHFDNLYRYITEKEQKKFDQGVLLREDILNLISTVPEKDMKQNSLEDDIVRLKNELKNKEEQLKITSQQLEYSKKAFDEITNSTSWKITKPIRKIKGIGKRG